MTEETILADGSGLILRSGSSGDRETLVKGLVVAVDLGFAKARLSCGLAWRFPDGRMDAEDLQFAACADKTATLFDKAETTATLIVEAPLSARFGPEGNPLYRGDFERQAATESRRASTRYWYSGPGAATCLAALFFLRRLRSKINARREVVLYEGFLTFKPRATQHRDDARDLLVAFCSDGVELLRVEQNTADSIITVAGLFATVEEEPLPPLIIRPPDLKTQGAGSM